MRSIPQATEEVFKSQGCFPIDCTHFTSKAVLGLHILFVLPQAGYLSSVFCRVVSTNDHVLNKLLGAWDPVFCGHYLQLSCNRGRVAAVGCLVWREPRVMSACVRVGISCG